MSGRKHWFRSGREGIWTASADESAQEFPLVHAVLERFATVDENDRNLVVELPAQFRIHIDVDLLPCKAAAARKLGEALFHHFAEMASLSGIYDDATRLWHAGEILARENRVIQQQIEGVLKVRWLDQMASKSFRPIPQSTVIEITAKLLIS